MNVEDCLDGRMQLDELACEVRGWHEQSYRILGEG